MDESDAIRDQPGFCTRFCKTICQVCTIFWLLESSCMHLIEIFFFLEVSDAAGFADSVPGG